MLDNSNFTILTGIWDNPIFILLIIVVIFLVIAGVAFGVYRLMHPKLKEEKPAEDAVAQEELDRILVPVDDEEVAEQISGYKDEELDGEEKADEAKPAEDDKKDE